MMQPDLRLRAQYNRVWQDDEKLVGELGLHSDADLRDVEEPLEGDPPDFAGVEQPETRREIAATATARKQLSGTIPLPRVGWDIGDTNVLAGLHSDAMKNWLAGEQDGIYYVDGTSLVANLGWRSTCLSPDSLSPTLQGPKSGLPFCVLAGRSFANTTAPTWT